MVRSMHVADRRPKGVQNCGVADSVRSCSRHKPCNQVDLPAGCCSWSRHRRGLGAIGWSASVVWLQSEKLLARSGL
eukprot:scaffold129550_cov60-Phaeocystis_antarctica.AAC.1